MSLYDLITNPPESSLLKLFRVAGDLNLYLIGPESSKLSVITAIILAVLYGLIVVYLIYRRRTTKAKIATLIVGFISLVPVNACIKILSMTALGFIFTAMIVIFVAITAYKVFCDP
jgi:hypothetical protein